MNEFSHWILLNRFTRYLMNGLNDTAGKLSEYSRETNMSHNKKS